jgi:glycosyltransferase involved in cell wall biosynthesis
LLYICIPAYNESTTLGVLLWRIRKVLLDYSRPYEILVFDDASTDSTRDVLKPYEKVLPLTVLGGKARVGYAGAIMALIAEAAARTRYPRRDALVLMQGDFTDQPESLPEMVKRFEGGADIVVAQRSAEHMVGKPRTLARLATLTTRRFLAIPDISDPFGTLRLFRISVIREMLKSSANRPVSVDNDWSANLELLLRAMKHSRRTENILAEQRYDVRTRTSRLNPYRDAWSLFRSSWRVRKLSPTEVST